MEDENHGPHGIQTLNAPSVSIRALSPTIPKIFPDATLVKQIPTTYWEPDSN